MDTRVKRYGIVAGIVLLALQYAVYLSAHYIALFIGIEPFSPRTAPDSLFPLVPLFIIPYIWSYFYWAMAPAAVSKCEERHFLNYIAAYLLSLLAGAAVLIFAPSYMDRAAAGLTDPSLTGPASELLRFWYTLDGSDTAFNLFPSFHCIASTLSYLGVARRKEVPLWYRLYSLVISILIFLSTLFVKQHFVADVVSGVFIGAACFTLCVKKDLGRFLRPLFFPERKTKT